MNRRASSKISLFLMELIIAILFFSLASAVCVRLYSAAHSLSEESINLSNALTWSQNLSEAFYGTKGDVKEMEKLYPEAIVSKDDSEEHVITVVLFFDDEWNYVDAELVDASYEVILETRRKSADEVYSDVNEYGITLVGDAVVGEVAAIDLRGTTEVYSFIPENEDMLLYHGNVDVYVGKGVPQ